MSHINSKSTSGMEQDSLHIASILISKFRVSGIFLVPEKRKLVILSSESPGKIMELLASLRPLMHGLRPEIMPPKAPSPGTPSAAPASGVNLPTGSITLYGRMHGRTNNSPRPSGLREKLIVDFDTSGLAPKDKIRFYQLLYGHEKKKPAKPKGASHSASQSSSHPASHPFSYQKYVYEGLLQKLGGSKIGKSALILDAVHRVAIGEFFRMHRVGYAEMVVYVK